MKNILMTGSLAVAGMVTAGLVAVQAPAAFADHGADDGARHSQTAGHRHDDGRHHGGHHGRHQGRHHEGRAHDRADDHGGLDG